MAFAGKGLNVYVMGADGRRRLRYLVPMRGTPTLEGGYGFTSEETLVNWISRRISRIPKLEAMSWNP